MDGELNVRLKNGNKKIIGLRQERFSFGLVTFIKNQIKRKLMNDTAKIVLTLAKCSVACSRGG